MLTVEEIREQYPEPTTLQEFQDKAASRDKDEGGLYCVGGALALAVSDSPASCFPDGWALGQYLVDVNPSLTMENAEQYGVAIIEANDSSNFDAAWDALDEALTYGRD